MKDWQVIAIMVGLIVISLLGSTMYWKYQYKSVIKERKEFIIDSLQRVYEHQKDIITEATKNNNKAVKRAKNINDKLIRDEKTIDNRVYSDYAIDSLLARFNKGSQ